MTEGEMRLMWYWEGNNVDIYVANGRDCESMESCKDNFLEEIKVNYGGRLFN